MTITDWADHQGLADIQADEAEPYVLPIILRVEKDATLAPSHEEAQLAVAHALILFFDDERIVNDGEWSEQVNKWLTGRIRKVARRARGKEWEAVKALGGIYATYGKAEVMILPPHPNFEPPAEVKKLQVSGMELEHWVIKQSNITEGMLVFAENPDITFTTGKSLAQIGHAVQLAIFNSSKEKLQAWKNEKLPIMIAEWNSFEGVEIRDAGFTEVLAGSLTAKGALL